MSTDQTMEAGFLEKLGDKLNAFSEGVAGFITRLLGSSNERFIRKLGYIRARDGSYTVIPGSLLAQVNELEPKMKALDTDGLRGLTVKFRERLAQGETLDDVLPEAFAACREAAFRTKNMRHFDVQILGGAVLHKGNIAEMVTGEGKTLVATLPAYLNALEAKGVHVITVNDYLARRDCEWMLPIYRALGISAGFIQSDMDPVERRKAYDCDITYGTNSEFGFDYLRDNMKPARWADPHYPPWQQQCQKALNFAIIDEVDNILIDEARTPLIISGQAFGDLKRFARANEIALQLGELQKQHPGRYFEIKEKEHTCHLTDEGIREAEKLANVESFYTAGNMEWPHLIDNALKAHYLYKRDKQYAVMRHPETNEMSIIIIDEFTGRLMVGRQWSDGLHQAVEAKHGKDGVQIKQETQTLATITIQNFFKLYKKLAGMTGTAMTEANEFWKIYKLDVIAVPTNKPLVRKNYQDVIFRTEKEKWKAVIDEVVEVHNEGRPMLIGTVDVDKSLKLSEMLKRRGIKHELLNALPEHAAREAEIVAQAGRIGAVTIATNMAGRGTDIILGGNPETLAWSKLKDKYATRLDVPEEEWKALVDEIEQKEKMKEEGRKVAKLGGMHIIGTERHEARRIDNQLRGRAGRQGDPGSGRFYLCLEDDLMRIFGGEWVKNVLTRLGMEDGQAIESRMVSRRIQAAQKKREEYNFDIRKNLLEYDEVMDHQRKEIYGYRQKILNGSNCKLLLLDMIEEQIGQAVDRFLADDYGPSSFAEFAANRLGVECEAADFRRSNFEEADQTARDKASRMIPTQIQEALDENLSEDVESSDWNWQAMAESVNRRWGLKFNERELKKIGRDNLAGKLIEAAEKALAATDLSGGKVFLQADWGKQSLVDWVRLKFGLNVHVEDLAKKDEGAIKDLLCDQVLEAYRQKEIELPVKAGMARFMSEQKPQFGSMQQRYDRDGLYHWAKQRFGAAAASLSEEEFRTQSRLKLQERLTEVSKHYFPKVRQEEIDVKLEDAFQGTRLSESGDAKELVDWAKSALEIEVDPAELTGVTREQARQVLWNAFDNRYRPEMRGVERGLLLNRVDMAWKNHLYTMDHLRAGIGLMGYAQVDPKTEYKREGMKEFRAMQEGLQDKVTDAIFRLEEEVDFQESVWAIQAAEHKTYQAPPPNS
ncbi:MAG: preprotein translocase subunit SecA, partial [Planctomycetia bacterium]|nr:preprotein translocase subunit SecA [Planctomycetia bacterium]